MERVTNKERLQSIKDSLTKGINFIKSDKVKINKDFGGMGIIEINKNIGSDLCCLYNSLEQLESLINQKKVYKIR